MATTTRVLRYRTTRCYDHHFFPSVALFILVAVFLGFAQTFYLKGIVANPIWKGGAAFAASPLPLIVKVHGAIFSSWILLLVTQTSLVAAGRVELHRRLGLAGFGLACLMVLVGLAATCELLAHLHPPGDPELRFPLLQAVDLTVFSTLVYFGFRERFNPVEHKRLMLIATITLLDAAFVRWPILIKGDFLVAEMCCYALLILMAGYDLWSTGKVHVATLWGSGLLVVAHHPILSILQRYVVWHGAAIYMQRLGELLR